MNTSMSKTETEFDPAYFKGLFGEASDDWKEFVAITIRTFESGQEKLTKAVSSGDMGTISDTRHALGPSLQQWGALSLEYALRTLDEDDLQAKWDILDLEFDDLMLCLKKLEA